MSSSAWRSTMREVSRSKYSSTGRPLTTMFPPPALSQTRAIAVLRLPVAYVRVSAVTMWSLSVQTLVCGRGQRQGLGLLGAGRVVVSNVELELGQHLAAEPALREHPPHGLLDREGAVSREQMPVALGAKAAGNARVAVVKLLVELRARQEDLVRVHDDDEVPRVLVGSVLGLWVAARHVGDLAGQTAERLSGRVHHPPSARPHGLGLGHHVGLVGRPRGGAGMGLRRGHCEIEPFSAANRRKEGAARRRGK